MIGDWFGAHLGLAASARFPPLAPSARRISAVELLMLLGCGAAAAVGLSKLGPRIPGHAIVLAALPMAFGLSLAPRRLAGSVMGAGAVGTALLLAAAGGAPYGSGSVVSLFLLGPMMDVALHGARTGRLVYVALVLSGVGRTCSRWPVVRTSVWIPSRRPGGPADTARTIALIPGPPAGGARPSRAGRNESASAHRRSL